MRRLHALQILSGVDLMVLQEAVHIHGILPAAQGQGRHMVAQGDQEARGGQASVPALPASL